MRRSGARLGRAAAKRRAAGGPRVTGRPALSVKGWRALLGLILVRARGRCEWCGTRLGILDPEHATPTGRGGADSWDNVSIICRPCHDLKTFGTVETQKLVIHAHGDGRFYGRLWGQGLVVEERGFGRPPRPDEAAILATLR